MCLSMEFVILNHRKQRTHMLYPVSKDKEIHFIMKHTIPPDARNRRISTKVALAYTLCSRLYCSLFSLVYSSSGPPQSRNGVCGYGTADLKFCKRGDSGWLSNMDMVPDQKDAESDRTGHPSERMRDSRITTKSSQPKSTASHFQFEEYIKLIKLTFRLFHKILLLPFSI